MDRVDFIFHKKGIKSTPNRILVLRAMLQARHPLALSDLEELLESVDKSSIFRVLNFFSSHHIVHEIDDGSGKIKYEVCSGEEECSIEDMHVHFYCEFCHKTMCLEDRQLPHVDLPQGFVLHSANYVLKGTCRDCSEKQSLGDI